MKIYSAEGQQFLSFLSNGIRPRALHTSIAIAKAIADSLILPTSQVEDPDGLFRTMCSIDANSKLSPINELVPLDIETIISYIPKFWKVRYYTMFPRYPIECWDNDASLIKLFGLGYAIDLETVKVIRDNFVDLANTYNKVHLLINEKGE